MSKEIKNQVSAALATANIAFNAKYRGLKKNALGSSSDMDEWACSFNGTEFAFFTGLGLRALPDEHAKRQARYDVPGVTSNDITRRTIYGKRYLAALETYRKPQAPHPADVLYSLILDSRAVGQSFVSWCSDFGYDEDSRKALATYTVCQEIADKLNSVFRANRATLDKITELLQEY